MAASRGYREVVDILLEFGADMEAVDRYGRRPLHLAPFRGHADVAQDSGADKEAVDRWGQRPLHVAAQKRMPWIRPAPQQLNLQLSLAILV